MNEKKSIEQNSMNYFEKPLLDKAALFSGLLGVKYPMAQDPPAVDQKLQEESKEG